MSRVANSILLLALLVTVCHAVSAEDPQVVESAETKYLTFQLMTGIYGYAGPPAEPGHFALSKTQLGESVHDVIKTIGTTGDARHQLGFTVGPLCFDMPDEETRQFIRDAFTVARENDVAVAFHIDDSMCWGERKDLLSNPDNIETADWKQEPDTLPALTDDVAPRNLERMWAGFDPRAEPLEVETLKQWEEDGVELRLGAKETLRAKGGAPREFRVLGATWQGPEPEFRNLRWTSQEGRGDDATREHQKPNLLFIFADDWGWGDLGCHGHPWLKTPNIDRLATEGTEFYQFTVASGVCSPSRAAVMTGHFPARHGLHGHFATVESHAKRGMPDWLDPKVVLLPRLLKQGGYATAHFGKWHLTNIMVPDAPLPNEYGYDTYAAFNCSGPQMPVHDDARLAIEFIRKSHTAGQPFFVNLWIHEPHTPHYPKPEYLRQFAHLNDEAQQIYAAVLAHADARIGEVLAEVEQLGLTNNTLVIFSSDNGPENTGPPSRRNINDDSTGPGLGAFASVGTTGGRRGRKRSLLQGGIGVPFIAKWPGKIAAGKVDDATPITAVDLLPTFCEIAQVELPKGYKPDGVSQLDALLGKLISNRAKPIFWQWKAASSRNDTWPTLAVRQGQWKLLLGQQDDQVELFRFPEDHLETTNLREKHADEVRRLKVLIETWKETLPEDPNENCFSEKRGQ